MSRISEFALGGWRARQRQQPFASAQSMGASRDLARRFNLLRWFSIFGFVAVFIISFALAAMLSHFMTREIVEHDAILTSQFIASVATTQSSQAKLGPKVTLGQILDERANFAALGVDPQLAESARKQFYDHLQFLPDVLLAHVFARDRKVIWSTNPAMIGRSSRDNDELEKAFASRVRVSLSYLGHSHEKDEQQFVRQPAKLFVENYVPLYDSRGDVVVVVEIYKEPHSLLQTIDRGHVLVWTCSAFGAIFLYLALFWIIRRADATLNEQQQRLVEAEALCVIGEMSAAVAHGIRNPLATIRSSAELALEGDLDSTRRNARDIITQIDRLGRWVRDLLMFSRPLSGENRHIDLVSLAEDCVQTFTTQLEKSGIACEVVRPSLDMPPVIGDPALATQALANVLSNAIEAMPQGGTLRLELQHTALRQRVDLAVTDSGPGLAAADIDLIFKPYYTTKRNGLGLGMALVKRIMERFGGAVHVHSRLGEGTRVVLSFSASA